MTAAATSPPSVSVVIPHYGNAQSALALVQALAEQIYPGEVQIIVVDDGSPTPFPSDTPGVSVVRRAVNGGYGSTVNTGVRTAVGDLLLILNSDLEVGDDFVRDLVSNSAPWMPAVTSPRIVDLTGQEAWTGRRFPRVRHQTTEWLIPLARWRSRGHLDDAVGRDSRARGAAHDTTVDFVAGAAMLMPRSVFEAVGGFDERFFMNSEEADLQRRLRLEGIVSVALRHPIAVHEGGGSSDPARRREWIVASRLKYAEKWGHPRILRAALTMATGVNFAWNSVRQLRGRDVDATAVARAELSHIWTDRVGQANTSS